VAPARRLWVHAVSVGEVGVAATLMRALPASTPLVLTTVTPTGQAVARRALAGRSGAAEAPGATTGGESTVRVAYLPFDLGFAVRRFLDAFTPSALVLVEGDLWPLLLSRVKQRSLPVVVVNGRVSDRGFARLRRLRRWVGPILSPVDFYGVQTGRDRDRLLALGVAPERVRVTGNLKFESPEPPALEAIGAAVRGTAGSRPILIAGSTMDGEEKAVLEAFAAVGPQRALLVLAPRHPERAAEVAALAAERGWNVVRRSRLELDSGDGARAAIDRVDVLLLDTMGELASLYRHAAAVFIGGTLVHSGGHNPLEAARFGVPIAVGPSMHNFAEMAALFDSRSAWRRVADGRELGAVWRAWLDDPGSGGLVGERAAALLDENRGALERTLELVRPLLSAPAR
jgi:3-deoxy-D-manno-octulosonic-acid transferase